ncbi:MAG: FxLYD domain-containing protein [Caldilineaceae bacterium]|nr:FxLYD domain-containing protein [Caldilineaceae bacterium]
MRQYQFGSFFVILLLMLLASGCVMPAPAQPQPGAVVQGSTAAPTEPAGTPMVATAGGVTASAATATPVSVGIVDVPTGTPTQTPLPPTHTATPLSTASDTPSPPGSPTGSPTSAPTAVPTGVSPSTPTPLPIPAPTKTPYPTGIFVANHRGFSNGSSYFVVGEVLNTGRVPVFGAKVIANFYDSAGKQVGAGQALASLAMTEPEVGNPFKLKIENLASAVSRYELTVTWEDVSLIEFRHLTVLDGAVGEAEVVGKIRNDQESPLTSIVVAVTFYDAAGVVVDTADIFLGGQTVAPGESLPFSIPLTSGERVYDHFWIEAQGNVNLF